MKVTINENGMLIIKAETPLEAYALKKWSNENEKLDCKNITLVFEANSTLKQK